MPIVLSRKGGLGGTGGTGTAQALSIGVSTGGNTAGNTKVSTGSRFVIVGSNGITASQATAAGATTVTLSGITQSVQTEGVVSLGVSSGGNTVGDTTVNTGSRFVLAGGNGITLSQATAAGATTVTISGGAGAAAGTLSMWPDQMPQSTTVNVTNHFAFTSAATRTTLLANVFPIAVPAFLTVNKIKVPLFVSLTSATTNSHWNWTAGHSFGIYSLTGNSLSLLSSFSNNQLITYSSAANSTNASVSWQLSYGSGAGLSSSTSISSNNAGVTGPWSSISSMKNNQLAKGNMSLSAGQYFGLLVFSSSSAGANLASFLQLGIQAPMGLQMTDLGENVLTVAGLGPLIGRVTVTQTNTALPGSFATADITTRTNDGNVVRISPLIQMLSQE